MYKCKKLNHNAQKTTRPSGRHDLLRESSERPNAVALPRCLARNLISRRGPILMRKPWHPESHAQPVPPPRQDLSPFLWRGRVEAQTFGSKPILSVALKGTPAHVPCRWHGVTQVTLRAAEFTGLVACNRAEGIEGKDHHDPGLPRELTWIGSEPLGRDPNNGFDIKRSRNPASVKVHELTR